MAGFYTVELVGTIAGDCIPAVILPGVEVPQGLNNCNQCENFMVSNFAVDSQPSCDGSDKGSIYVALSGGTGPYAYELYQDNVLIDSDDLDASGIIGDLTAGNYVIVITDGNGCEAASQTLGLAGKGAITVAKTIVTTNATECGNANGTVTVTVTGTVGYTYVIDGINGTTFHKEGAVQPSLTFNETLSTGEYLLTIIDANNCVAPAGKFTIGTDDSNFEPAFTVTTTNGDCDNNGIITITLAADPGTAVPNYYSLDGGAWKPFTGKVVTIPAAIGAHTIRVMNDTEDCISNERDATVGTTESNTFTATVTGTTSETCGLANGSITVKITGAAGNYDYYINATHSGTFPIAAGVETYTITGLATGFYNIVISNEDPGTTGTCPVVFTIPNVEVQQGINDVIAAPSATTPQTFCSGAKVKNLQADGVNLVWYDSLGNEMDDDDPLTDGAIYYVAQGLSGGCESAERTAVKVIIDNTIVIPAPNLPGLFELCQSAPPLTLADIPTYGNTNIIWYSASTGGTLLPSSTPIVGGTPYYAAISGGGICESYQRTEVIITIVTGETPEAPEMETEQHFCDGALVANLATPNNQIAWYLNETDLTPLGADVKLIDNHTYWAAQKAGSCESDVRIAVLVLLDQYPEPVIMPEQTICDMTNPTLGDLTITGTGIRWYTGTGVGPLPLTTSIKDGDVFLVTQSIGNCESDPVTVTITKDCHAPYGTMFPFVNTGNTAYDNLFVTTARLYAMPPKTVADKVGYVRKQTPLQTVRVTYYDCTSDTPITDAPQYPGTVGAPNNPGLSIRWEAVGIDDTGIVDDTRDPCPNVPIGKYAFEKLAAGNYVLELSRAGFMSRYGVITVTGDDYLDHRELIGGDINGDLIINDKDLTAIRLRECFYGSPLYDYKYDFFGNLRIDDGDTNIIRTNIGATQTIYLETKEWPNL
jgi:hypothetical protein